jgi:hypothetical protein
MTWRPFGKKNADTAQGSQQDSQHDSKDENPSARTPLDFNENSENSDSSENADKAAGISEKKGAPTPKRSVAQAKNIHPLVPDRKLAKEEYKRAKAQRREHQNDEYVAMQTGDVKNMPKAERIPSRVYIRDYIDARVNLGEFFIPVIIVLFIASFALSGISGMASTVLILIVYVYLVAVIVDTFIMWHKLKKLLTAKYGPKATARGSRTAYYAWSRAIQMRRWRMPKPRTKKRGNWPK